MKKWGLYTAVLLIAVAAAGCFGLTGNRLGAYVTASMSENTPDAVFACRESRLDLPPGLVLEGFRIDFRNRSNAGIEAERLVLRPKLLELLTGRLLLRIHADAYGGNLDGNIDYLEYFTTSGPLRAELHVAGIDLEKCLYLRAIAAAPLTGQLKGEVNFTGKSSDILRGTGQARLSVRGCRLPVAGHIKGFGGDSFDSLDARVAFNEGTIQVGQLLLGSRGMQSSLKGHIFLREGLRESILSLSGKLELTGMSQLKFNFTITGTISRPVVTLL